MHSSPISTWFYLIAVEKINLYGSNIKSGGNEGLLNSSNYSCQVTCYNEGCCFWYAGGVGAIKSLGRGQLSRLCGCFWQGGLLSRTAEPYLANSCWRGWDRQVLTSSLSLWVVFQAKPILAIIELTCETSLYFVWFYRIWIIRKKHFKSFCVHQPIPFHPLTHT